MGSPRIGAALAVLATLTLAAAVRPATSAAQATQLPGSIPTGRILEHVAAAGDSSQSFALYLPRSYRPDRRWPLVVLLDPRGRADVPLRRLVPAAERLGYVVASSYNTASDVEGDPNTPAVNAIFGTLQPRLSLDARRFYLFGMSGTARAAWALGYAAAPHVVGVAGFGAGMPPDMDLDSAFARYGAPFAFYGGAGEDDFNHAELVLLAERLDAMEFPHAVVSYPGPHGWPQDPREFTAALSWLHWMTMRRGLLAPDTAWLDSEYDRRMAEASELEARGELGPAWLACARLASDAAGFLEQPAAADCAARLAEDPEVASWRARRLELARAHIDYGDRASDWLRGTMAGRLPSLEDALADLAVDSLRALAADTADAVQAAAARRALANLFSLTSFYLPRFYIERREWPRARLVLEIAEKLRPGAPGVRRQLDQVRAATGS